MEGVQREAYNLKLRAKDGRANEFRHDCDVMAGIVCGVLRGEAEKGCVVAVFWELVVFDGKATCRLG